LGGPIGKKEVKNKLRTKEEQLADKNKSHTKRRKSGQSKKKNTSRPGEKMFSSALGTKIFLRSVKNREIDEAKGDRVGKGRGSPIRGLIPVRTRAAKMKVGFTQNQMEVKRTKEKKEAKL